VAVTLTEMSRRWPESNPYLQRKANPVRYARRNARSGRHALAGRIKPE
jgi:hypothetical protein